MAIKDINDADFDAEVIKSNVPVIVDVWAPWCVAPESRLMINKRDTTLADSIAKSDSLLAYDGKRVISSPVLYSRTTSRGGHCKKITTENNRIIKMTDDHLLYTSKGWKRADRLKGGDMVAIYPAANGKADPIKDSRIIITRSDLDEIAGSEFTSEGLNKEIMDLLPLKYDNPKMHIIARLIGALFSDGTLYSNIKNHYYNLEFFLGQKEDVSELAADLKELGKPFSVKKRINKFDIAGRRISIKTYRVRVSSKALWAFMMALGVPSGKKTDSEYLLPDWLIRAPMSLKREFLSGYLGGDGPSILVKVVSRGKRGDYNSLKINDIESYKSEENLDNGLRFSRQISKLLEEQGVRALRIHVGAEKYRRKDGTTSRSIHISLSNSFETAQKLTAIGYAYSWQKQKQSNYVGEFLIKKLRERKVWMRRYNSAMSMFKDKLGAKEIGLRLGISHNTVSGWVYHGNSPTINYTFERYDKWLHERTKNLTGGLVWESVNEIRDVYLPKVQVLTIDKYSNFIANGFLVHNCGPCRMYTPIIEDVSKEYEGKIKFVKVNADENEKIMMKFNISSIPTTLLIKNGQLKAMNVGAVPRETLRKWILQNM